MEPDGRTTAPGNQEMQLISLRWRPVYKRQTPAVSSFAWQTNLQLWRVFCPERPLARPIMASFDSGTDTHLRILAELRHVSMAALNLAVTRGLVFFGNYRGYSAWFVTDASRRAIQARRLDGRRWWANGPKALNIPGTTPSWPVGAECLESFSHVVAVEGSPDLLAVFHFLDIADADDRTTAVAILGASNNIHPDAVSLFNRKCVRIIPHRDRVGAAAAALRWKTQFESGGATADVVPIEVLAPMVAKANDLNDLCLLPDGHRVASALIAGFL